MQIPTRKQSKPSSSDPTLAAMDSLRRIVRAIRLFSHTTRKRMPVSGAQLFVLQSLADEPGMSLKDLAARTLTDQSSVSVVVSRLVDKRMIKRRTATDDARRSHLELTARGRAVLHEAPLALQTRLIDGLRSLPRKELDCVANALRKLVVRLGAEGETPTMFFEAEPARERERQRRSRVGA